MCTKTGLLISTSIVLMVSIAIGFCGADSSMKTQLQNAVGKDGEPCAGVTEENCGGPEDECKYCIEGLSYSSTPQCMLEGDVLSDDTYHICCGTSETKYCRFNTTVPCGYKYFCVTNYINDDMECIDDECHSNIAAAYCRQCMRGSPWPNGAITAEDEKCQ